MPGVYRLIDGDEAVCLGESNGLKGRLKSHRQKYLAELQGFPAVHMSGRQSCPLYSPTSLSVAGAPVVANATRIAARWA